MDKKEIEEKNEQFNSNSIESLKIKLITPNQFQSYPPFTLITYSLFLTYSLSSE